MFFRETTLVLCNRMALNGSTSITIRPSTKTQMVLGTNSSGKSSLLSIAFCPLPPDPSWFDDGGSIHQVFDHKGHTYEILCQYGAKNSYSFIVDGGENLNKGRTITAQYDLVRLHLGYTKEFHNLATGVIEFTGMSPQLRRDWIARFSPTDFGFAFAKYNLWKKLHGSKVSIVKYLKDRLVEARGNLIDPADLLEMRKKANELHETLESLMQERTSSPVRLSDERMSQKIEELDQGMVRYLTTEFPSTNGVDCIEELITMSADAGEAVHELYGQLKVREEQFYIADNKREMIERSTVRNPTAMKEELKQAEEDLKEIPELVCGLHPSLLVRAPKAISELRMAVAGLPGERFTPVDYNSLTQGLFEKKERFSRVSGLLDDINRQIEHIHNCETVECPGCHTTFKPGIEAGKLDELKQRAEKGSVVSSELEEEVTQAECQLQDISAAVEAYSRLDEIRAEYQSEYPGLFLFLDNCGWSSAGRGLTGKLAIYERDVVYADKASDLTVLIENLKLQLAQHESSNGEAAAIFKEYELAEKAYSEVHKQIEVAEAEKRRISGLIHQWTDYDRTYDILDNMFEDLRTDLIAYCSHQGDLMIEDMIKKTKQSIGIHEFALSEQETHETLVKDLEHQLEMAQIQEEAFRRLVAAMCPKKGLLAEQIGQQMESVINVVNKIIKRVWGYPLFLSHCDVTDTDLDYKFPITVDTKRRDDISEGSRSVKDVINQAFRLAAYYCMKLTDYPLFLDEIGSSFDEAHRHNLIPLIKDLVDDAHFSQVLIVSHTLDGQTAFPMSETIIMDDRNLSYPHAYNLHVEFE